MLAFITDKIQLLEVNLEQVAPIAFSALIIYILLILLSRLVGPRSFSQMTAFDFAVTVALGAIVGATATGGVSLINGVTGLAVLFILRWIVAFTRRYGLTWIVDNSPLMIMDGPEILPEYLERAKITEKDLLQNLRKQGITHLDQVRGVVMERDGTISVLRADQPFDPYLLKGVKGHPATGEIHIDPSIEED